MAWQQQRPHVHELGARLLELVSKRDLERSGIYARLPGRVLGSNVRGYASSGLSGQQSYRGADSSGCWRLRDRRCGIRLVELVHSLCSDAKAV